MTDASMTAPALSIVVPAYNEAARIERTLRDIDFYCRGRGGAYEVLVVDDGSRDHTAELVRSLSYVLPSVRLIRLPSNFGKGFAVRTGVLNANGASILFADADGATPIEEVARLEAVLAEGADIAIGSRALRDDRTRVRARLYRRAMGRVFHGLVRVLAVRGFRDTQCGFKLFRREAAHDLFARMRMNGFSFDVELLLMAGRRGYTVREVPVNWTHQDGSRINLVVDSLSMAIDLFAIRGNVLRGQYDQPRIAHGPRATELVAAAPRTAADA